MPRAYTLQDVLAGLAAQVKMALSPPTVGPVLLDQLAGADEKAKTVDVSTVALGAGSFCWGPATPLTLSGNEITDATRTAALAWGTSQAGGSTDGLTLPAGLGIWEGATNLFTHGQNDTSGAYASAVNGGASTTFAIDATVPAPFSPQSIKFTEDGVGTNQGGQAQTATGQALAVGTKACGSIWMKGTAGQSYRCLMVIVNTDASTTSGTVLNFTATGAWQPVAPVAVAVAAGKTGDRVAIRVQTGSARAESFWVAHPMLQSGTGVVTPYIATTAGATATRAAGRVQAPAALLTAAQGWVAAKIRTGFASTAPPASGAYLFDWRTDASNLLALRYNAASQWEAVSILAGVSAGPTVATAFSSGATNTVVVAWGAFGVALSVNGAAFVIVATSLPAPTSTLFDIGSAAGGNQIDGDVLWAACGIGTLTNADAATLNALGSAYPTFATLPSARMTMISHGVDSTALWPTGGWNESVWS